jgi:16S rRNA (adenine1518-N6/adenine1519-N6)-dimethyltransferase
MPSRTEGFRPRRRFGQNFLIDRGAIDRIVAAFAPREDDRVLEVGPGRGALTRRLAGRVASLVAVEIDRDLAAGLDDLFRDPPPAGLRIVRGDVLDLDLATLLRETGAAPGRPARVLANLPYNIATAVILRLLEQRALLSDLMVMVQREVAARIRSAPGGRDYGSLSVLCQSYARIDTVLRLGPASFRPRPRVDSEVIHLTLRDPGGAAGRDPRALAALLRVAFAHRRKTLLNNLLALPAGHEEAEAVLRKAGIDPGVRPEMVPIEAFHALLMVARSLLRPSPSGADEG